MTDDDKNLLPWQIEARRIRDEAHKEGRTYATGRCNCYEGGAGHSPNSGRCYFGQGSVLYTLPEREGVCDDCWNGCGFADRAARKV